MADLPSFWEYIKKERVFLHDISNQIVIANGMAGLVLEKLEAKENLDDKDMERMKKALKALEKMIAMLTERRTFVKSVPVPETQT
jgi:hypothetical protein